MLVKLTDGRQLKLMVNHYQEVDENDLPIFPEGYVLGPLNRDYRAKTTAELFDANLHDTPLSKGTAYCVEGDQFRKKVGVKIAVQRCIAHLPREDRKLIWKRVWNLK